METLSNEKSCLPPLSFTYNEFGLRTDVNYIFNDDGAVNWRAMVNPKYLVVNKQWFTDRKKPIPDKIDGLEDNQLLILLAGIRELASLRNYIQVLHNPVFVTESNVTVVTTITWGSNYETNYQCVKFQAMADATTQNCNGFGKNFLASIAENRGFVRCVRNFLGINICGSDEVGPSREEIANSSVASVGHSTLENLMKNNSISFLALTNILKRDNKATDEEIKSWHSVKDIPSDKLMGILEYLQKGIQGKQK